MPILTLITLSIFTLLGMGIGYQLREPEYIEVESMCEPKIVEIDKEVPDEECESKLVDCFNSYSVLERKKSCPPAPSCPKTHEADYQICAEGLNLCLKEKTGLNSRVANFEKQIKELDHSLTECYLLKQ